MFKVNDWRARLIFLVCFISGSINCIDEKRCFICSPVRSFESDSYRCKNSRIVRSLMCFFFKFYFHNLTLLNHHAYEVDGNTNGHNDNKLLK